MNEKNKNESGRDESSEIKIVRSEELFQGSREVIILHSDDRYRLMITKAGKLILNK
jgi:hemin uptake protein HemP